MIKERWNGSWSLKLFFLASLCQAPPPDAILIFLASPGSGFASDTMLLPSMLPTTPVYLQPTHPNSLTKFPFSLKLSSSGLIRTCPFKNKSFEEVEFKLLASYFLWTKLKYEP